jgi:hypothetical protein
MLPGKGAVVQAYEELFGMWGIAKEGHEKTEWAKELEEKTLISKV